MRFLVCIAISMSMLAAPAVASACEIVQNPTQDCISLVRNNDGRNLDLTATMVVNTANGSPIWSLDFLAYRRSYMGAKVPPYWASLRYDFTEFGDFGRTAQIPLSRMNRLLRRGPLRFIADYWDQVNQVFPDGKPTRTLEVRINNRAALKRLLG